MLSYLAKSQKAIVNSALRSFSMNKSDAILNEKWQKMASKEI